MKRLLLICIVIAALIMGCKKDKPEASGEITSEVTKPITVTATTMKQKDLPEFVRISGTLEGKTDIMVISEVSGKLMKLHKKLGDWVEKDEEIGQVDSEIISIQLAQTQAAVTSAEVTYLTTQNNLVTTENLYKKKTVSKTEYDTAVSNEKGAKAQWDGAIAQQRQMEKMLESAKITAPAAGYISELPITLGNLISQGTVLCRIVNSKILMIKTGVGESVIKQIKANQKVNLTSKKEGRQFEGKIAGFGVAPMRGSMNYPIEIEIKNKYNLLAGEIVQAHILSTTHTGVFVINQEALLKEFDTNFVFVINNKDVVKRQKVKVVRRIDENIIVEGLKNGDRIVDAGIENLKDGNSVIVRSKMKE